MAIESGPFVSVIICTRNRARQLTRVLGTATQMTVPTDLTWELVLVDNGSTDATPDVASSFADKLPIRYVHEPEAGISNARNCGVRNARGRYICWTDDDVMLDRGWLAAWVSAFRDNPDCDYFAGCVRPVLEGQPPRWFSDCADLLSDLIARRDLGPVGRPLSRDPADFPMGANYAVRGDILRQYPFDPRLGVSPHFRRVGEETAVLRAIRASGAKGYWVPEAIVDHLIPETRQTLDYVFTYQRSVGETWAALSDIGGIQFMGQLIDRSGRTFRGAPLWLWRLVIVSWLSWHSTRLRGRMREIIPALQKYGYYRGALDYLTREHRQRSA
jgi:glycosyltransferase involved in cell wall biosynthesis